MRMTTTILMTSHLARWRYQLLLHHHSVIKHSSNWRWSYTTGVACTTKDNTRTRGNTLPLRLFREMFPDFLTEQGTLKEGGNTEKRKYTTYCIQQHRHSMLRKNHVSKSLYWGVPEQWILHRRFWLSSHYQSSVMRVIYNCYAALQYCSITTVHKVQMRSRFDEHKPCWAVWQNRRDSWSGQASGRPEHTTTHRRIKKDADCS